MKGETLPRDSKKEGTNTALWVSDIQCLRPQMALSSPELSVEVYPDKLCACLMNRLNIIASRPFG